MKNNIFTLVRLMSVTLFSMFALASLAQSTKIGVQGILRKGDGKSVEDGNYAITFRLYDVATGGTALWSEVQSQVEVAGGIYSVQLGSVNSLSLPFNSDYYLSVQVSDSPEITPRQQLTVAPYALSFKGTGNVFPSSGAIGIGITSPASGSNLHLKNASGVANQLTEGTTGSRVELKKGTATATIGHSSSGSFMEINNGANTVMQYNGTEKLVVTSTGVNLTGTGSFSNGLTVSSGTLTLGNISFSGSSIDCPADMDMKFGTSTKLTVNSEGVSISGHLTVAGSWSYYNSDRVAYYANDGGNTCVWDGCLGTGQTTTASINSTSRVRASEFNSYSDQRIKRDIILSDAKRDMDIMRRLQVANYRHKDVVEKGADFKKGFIAQEVEQVFPEAVAVTTDFIPDVYQLAVSAATEGNNLLVRLSQPHELKAGDKVRVINPQGQREYMICTVPDDRHLTIAGWDTEKPEWLFVYGKEVDDFRQVDYDRIHTLNVSVTQELIRSMEALESEIAELKIENNTLKERRDRLEAGVRKLEASVSN